MTKQPNVRRVILISGANKGIGNAVARGLASDPANQVFLGARDAAAAERAANELSTAGGDVRGIQLDVTDACSIARAMDRMRRDAGRLDVLINNAGIALERGAPPSAVPLDVVRATYEVNVFGAIAMTHAAIPLLHASSAPHIVNVSSGLASLTLRSDPKHFYYSVDVLAYDSSKTALNAVTVCFAHEFLALGWKINAADPGYTATDLNGFSGTRTVEQAAAIIVHLATLPPDGPTGGFFSDDCAVPW